MRRAYLTAEDGHVTRALDVAISSVLAAAALTMTVLAVRREILDARPMIAVRSWQVSSPELYAKAGNLIGPADAPVTLVVFADYECGFCRRMDETIAAVQVRQHLRFRTVYRHYPIKSRHAHAEAAALAAECAAEQGHFEEYHRALMKDSAELSTEELLRLAAKREHALI